MIKVLSYFPELFVCRVGGLVPATDAEKTDSLMAADIFVSLSDNIQRLLDCLS